MERVLGASAVRGRVGEWADGLEQLDHRARPAVRHDQRQRVLVSRLHVDEVDVQPVDLGLELRQRIQSRLAPAPVVLGCPVAGELLGRRQLHTLRPIGDEFPGGPARRRDTTAELGQLLFRNVDVEGTDVAGGVGGATHDDLLCRWTAVRLSFTDVAGRPRSACIGRQIGRSAVQGGIEPARSGGDAHSHMRRGEDSRSKSVEFEPSAARARDRRSRRAGAYAGLRSLAVESHPSTMIVFTSSSGWSRTPYSRAGPRPGHGPGDVMRVSGDHGVEEGDGRGTRIVP